MAYRIAERFGAVDAHQLSAEALWQSLWRDQCELGVFPFNTEACTEDFDIVFAALAKANVAPPYDFDKFAAAFFPQAEKITRNAEAALDEGRAFEASKLFLRASSLYRIARFPIIRSPKQLLAWERNKDTFFKAGGLLDPPIRNISIEHIHRVAGEGSHIQVAVRTPKAACSDRPVPLIIRLCGLDGYRTEIAAATDEYMEKGWACVAVEIPGTADSPAMRGDPTSADRQWSSLLDWVDRQPHFDATRRCVWGFSTGGYHAIRIAVTHKDRLSACVSHGGGCHDMFDSTWLDGVNSLEYPFELAPALGEAFGFDDPNDMRKNLKKRFSLLENGMLDKDCSPLLLANGVKDEIFPIEDYYLAMEHGPAKAARLAGNRRHMGMPDVYQPIYDWIEQVFVAANK